MKFDFEMHKDKYAKVLKTKDKISLHKKLLIKFNILYFGFVMFSITQNRAVKNFSISINDDQITIINDMCEMYIGWKSVKSVKMNSSTIVIEYGFGKKITIPQHYVNFENKNEKLYLKNELESKEIGKDSYPSPLITIKNIILKLKFVYSIKDEDYFYDYDMTKSSRGKLITKLIRCIYTVYFLIFFVMAYVKKSMLFMVISIFLAYLMYHIYKKTKVRNSSNALDKLLFKYNDNYDSKTEKSVILADDGIYLGNSNVITFIEWAKINYFNIIETSKYIEISNKKSVIFWISTSAFNNSKEKDKFMETIKIHIDTNDI